MDSGMFTGSEDAENADSNSSNSTNPSPFLGRSLKRYDTLQGCADSTRYGAVENPIIFRYLGSFRSKKNKKQTSLETAEESLEPVDQKTTSPEEAQGTQEPCDQKAVVKEVIYKEVKQGESVFERFLILFKLSSSHYYRTKT